MINEFTILHYYETQTTSHDIDWCLRHGYKYYIGGLTLLSFEQWIMTM